MVADRAQSTPAAADAAASSIPPPPPPSSSTSAPSSARSPFSRHARARRGGLRRLLTSTLRVIDLQYRIWLTHAKLTLQRMVLYAALFGAAMLLGLLAIIFLYIGVFRVLTDVIGLRAVWAYLIFGGIHLVIAAALVFIGTSILGKKDDSKDKKASA